MKLKRKRKIVKFSIITLGILFVVAAIGLGYYNRSIESNVEAATDGCPSSDWVPVGDFCIMEDEIANDEKWLDANYECMDQEDARLCTTAEWMQACRLNEGSIISLNDMETDGSDNYEWVGDIENASGNDAVLIGENGCGDIDSEDIDGDQEHFRCCINRERY